MQRRDERELNECQMREVHSKYQHIILMSGIANETYLISPWPSTTPKVATTLNADIQASAVTLTIAIMGTTSIFVQQWSTESRAVIFA